MNPYVRNLLFAAPLMAATLIPYVWLADSLDAAPTIRLVLLGALGWWVALLLRIPVIVLARQRAGEKGQPIIVAVSGPAEELVRLALLVFVGLTLGNALVAGIGWAAIEIVYAVVQLSGMAVLRGRNDDRAREAKAFMRLQGMDHAFEPQAPFWSIVERFSANGIHISMGLLLVINPWLVLLSSPLHSLINFVFLRLMKRSFLSAQGSLLLISISILCATLAVLLR